MKTGLLLAGGALLPAGIAARPAPAKSRVGTRRKLGTLEVSSIGLGVQNMSRTYQTTVPTRTEMHRIIRTAYDHGVTLFDAAEAYGPFEVERILGEGVASFRNKVVLETKFGWNIDQKTGQRLPGLNSRPDHIRAVVDGMLQRLRTDRIDLLYQHRVDPAVPIEDVAGAIKDLIQQGKVLHYGLSEPGLQTVRRAHAVHPLTAIQNEYSLLLARPGSRGAAAVPGAGHRVRGVESAGRGVSHRGHRCRHPVCPGDIRGIESRFSPENLPANLALVELLRRWGTRKSAAPGQLALAWLLAQQPWIVPIPGTTQLAHLLENNGADAVRFTADELTQFNAELAAISIRGERLPAAVLQFSGVEAAAKG